MFNHGFILKILCISQKKLSFRTTNPRKPGIPQFQAQEAFFPKDASFLETNKIIGTPNAQSCLSLPVSSFIATEKSLF